MALDVGAAINAHQMQWNQSGRWSKIIIHLGYFHALTYFFDAIGWYVSGSRFDEMLY